MNTRLVVVEGLPGSGKSTLARFIYRQLALNRIPAVHVLESARPHPTNVVRLPHEPPVWDALDPGHMAERSVRKWRSFVRVLGRGGPVHVLDGHLLHWDFTTLLLAESDSETLRRYARDVFGVLREADPAVIHLRPADPPAALRRTAALRGHRWLDQQLATKLESPYARNRGYEGLKGWLELGRDLGAWTDELLAASDLRTLRLDPMAGQWGSRQRRVMEFTGVRYRLDWRFRAIVWKRVLAERTRMAGSALRDSLP